jgi:hypothetical protein
MTNTDRRADWDRMPGTCEISNGKGKVYRGMVRFERPCATCGERFGIHVTQSTADGEAHNSGFGLRNCEKHRMKMVPAGIGVSVDAAEKLRTANVTMKEELTGLYARNAALHAENEILKSRLAVYELPSMNVPRVSAFTQEPLTDAKAATTEELGQKWLEKNPQAAMLTHDTALKPLDAAGQELLQKWLAKNNVQKMPWEC